MSRVSGFDLPIGVPVIQAIDKMLATIIVLVIGIVIGYGIRELISMRRRAKAKRTGL